jgi:hypothetical protein
MNIRNWCSEIKSSHKRMIHSNTNSLSCHLRVVFINETIDPILATKLERLNDNWSIVTIFPPCERHET